jgi:hypothetical protein
MEAMPRAKFGEGERQGLELQEVTNAMVRIYKEQFGCGPTKARSAYAGPDTLVATIENSLTPAERNMIALDEHQRVRERLVHRGLLFRAGLAVLIPPLLARPVPGIRRRHVAACTG